MVKVEGIFKKGTCLVLVIDVFNKVINQFAFYRFSFVLEDLLPISTTTHGMCEIQRYIMHLIIDNNNSW